MTLWLAWFACVRPPPTVEVPPMAAPVSVDPFAPRPFAMDELRAALPVGARLRFRVESQGAATVEERWEVTAHTDDGCTIVSVVHDATTGEPLEASASATLTWADLVMRAAFPVALTTIADGTVTVPAGTFPTRRYAVHELDGTMRVLDFAPSVPGPPVQVVISRDGTTLRTIVRLEDG